MSLCLWCPAMALRRTRDSGYPQRPWLMTPILDAIPGSAQAYYNEKHMRTRVVIENTFSRLKNRWRCLHKDRVLHYRPLKCAHIILACSVLHNIIIDSGVTESEDEIEFETTSEPGEIYVERGEPTSELTRGRILREQLVRRLQHF